MPRLDFSALRDALRKTFATRLLLLSWNVEGLRAVVALREGGKKWRYSDTAASRLADFAAALDETLASLRAMPGVRIPRACLLVSRCVVPARLDLPIDPDSPRPAAQMQELVCAEMEPVLAEAGALWNIGAVLAARGLLTPEERERVALELAIRREQASSILFGQTACALSFVEQVEIEEALLWQEKLQTLEARLACGWTGFTDTEGEGGAPVWLAAAVGMTTWGRWESACAKRGLKLLGALPFAWSVSEAMAATTETDKTAPEPTATETATRVALEIHSEDVVAVLRRHGRVVAARNEGRMERPLEADWLLRIIEDWRSGGACALEIVCLREADQAAAAALVDTLSERWGSAPLTRAPAAAREGLLAFLTRRGRAAQKTPLPAIRFGLPRKPLWKKAWLWQLLAFCLTLSGIIGMEARQQAQIKEVQRRFDINDFEEKKKAMIAQKEAEFYREQRQANQDLAAKRQELARLIPELERLQEIERMTTQLPGLLRALAGNISDDVALEAVRNTPSGDDMGRVQIIGWSPNYSSAQTFALSMQAASGELGYVVAQTNVREAAGRTGQKGYQVSFWMLPVTEELGMEEEHEAAARPGANAPPQKTTGGPR
jgi:hypothetical protein